MANDDSGADLAVGHQAPGQECPAPKGVSGALQEGKALFSKEERAAIIQLVMGVVGAAGGRAVKLAVAALKFAAMLLLGAGVVAGYADGNELDEVGCTVAQQTDGAPHDARSAQAEKDATGKRPRRDGVGAGGPGGRPPGGRPAGGGGPERGTTGVRDYGITAPRDWSPAEAPVVCKNLERCFLRLRDGGVGLCDERGEVCRVALAAGQRGGRGPGGRPPRRMQDEDMVEMLARIETKVDAMQARVQGIKPEPEISEHEAGRVFVLMKRLENGAKQRKAALATVFRLTVLEGHSQRRTARLCRCVPALISLRVKTIESRFKMSIGQLRNYASVILEMEASVKGDKRRKRKGGDPGGEAAQEDADLVEDADGYLPEERPDYAD